MIFRTATRHDHNQGPVGTRSTASLKCFWQEVWDAVERVPTGPPSIHQSNNPLLHSVL